MAFKLINASAARPGNAIMVEEVPCIVKSNDLSKTGKHGHAKYKVDAVDIITGSKKVVLHSGHDKVDVPIIDKKPAQVLGISGDTAQVMDMETYENFDLDIPEELKGKVVVGGSVEYWNILDKKVLKSIKS